MGLLHWQCIAKLPLGHGPSVGNLSAWSEDNVVATCSPRVIMMQHVRRICDGEMIACVDSVENSVQFAERNDRQSRANAAGMALISFISKQYDSCIFLLFGFAYWTAATVLQSTQAASWNPYQPQHDAYDPDHRHEWTIQLPFRGAGGKQKTGRYL